MPNIRSIESEFISRITEIIRKNISDEKFGVSELAREVNMSRSNLLRKVKKLTNSSVSKFIREVRLKHARKMLIETSLSVSEIAYQVGFKSPSYFIKCFGESFGFSPGEAVNNNVGEGDKNDIDNVIQMGYSLEEEEEEEELLPEGIRRDFKWGIILVVAIIFWFLAFSTNLFKKTGPIMLGSKKNKEKSVAVLPFIYEGKDSSDVYLINGLMESTLNNLQLIEDLKVISRTTVKKYNEVLKTNPEISKELNATYLIEGSGKMEGNHLFLSIQLIEAATYDQLWSMQYVQNIKDIFGLQALIAKDIADEIKAIVSPEEVERINKTPTKNLVAYDFFLKGLDLLNNQSSENLKNSIPFFLNAIKNDIEYAGAYAALANAYYLLDNNQVDKQYSDSINSYADRALFFDAQLPQSLYAKALYYMAQKDYDMAVPYFEKALEYNPDYDLVYTFLLDLYENHFSNTEKYLEYALKGLQINLVATYDSTASSNNYLKISNAFIQSGFIEEAEFYVNKSLEYFPGNLYSEYLKAIILFAKNQDLVQLKEMLITTYEKDSTRLDIMQEVGKVYYYLEDYETSYKYYKKCTKPEEAFKLDRYRSENGMIGAVYNEVGLKEQSEKYLEDFKVFAENDPSIYKHHSLALYYSYIGETENAIEHMQLFSEEENYHFQTILFTPMDPMVDNIENLPEFQKNFQIIENKFSDYHDQIKATLEDKGLL